METKKHKVWNGDFSVQEPPVLRREPPVRIPKELEVIAERKSVSPKGVNIYSIPCAEYDVVRVSFVFHAGVKFQQRPFVATSVLSMLAEGSPRRTAQEIAEMLDFYGIYYDTSIDRDYAIVTVCSVAKFAEKALEILSDFLLDPLFPEDELVTHRQKRKQEIAMQRAKVDFIAREQFLRALYGDRHPYGAIYDPAEYDTLTREDLIAFYRGNFTRDRLFAVVSGVTGDSLIDRVKEIADRFPEGAASSYVPSVPVRTKRVYIEKPGVSQSAVRIGRLLFPRTDPDYVGMVVLNTILGGYFSSRLVNVLREEKGYTYGAYAGVINMEESGYMVVSTEVIASATRDAVELIFAELDRLTAEPVGEAELNLVKNVMIGEMMRVLDGPFGIADVTIENIQNDTDNGSVHRMVRAINAITPEELQRLAQKYFVREAFSTVIVGQE